MTHPMTPEVKEAVEREIAAACWEFRRSDHLTMLPEYRNRFFAAKADLILSALEAGGKDLECSSANLSPGEPVTEAGVKLEGVAAFAKDALRALWDGYEMDGGDIQELGLKHGLIRQTVFNPAIHRDAGGVGVEAGDEWFVEVPEAFALPIPTEPLRSGGWLPIESAPKDGDVLLYWPPSVDLAEMWCVDAANAHGPYRKPTHWMPLPAAPKQPNPEAKLEVLREALKPFADFASDPLVEICTDDTIVCRNLRLAPFRRARAALNSNPGEA